MKDTHSAPAVRLAFHRALLGLSLLLLSACATKGFTRKSIEQNRLQLIAQMAEERARARQEADSLRREVEELQSSVARLGADASILRTELQQLRTEFGAKISAAEGQVMFNMPVNFDFNDWVIRPVDMAQLDKMAVTLAKYYEGARILITGYADAAGGVDYNRKLSQRRADAVKRYLASKGVDSSSMVTVGRGKALQVRKNAKGSDQGSELNRRVTFTIETPIVNFQRW